MKRRKIGSVTVYEFDATRYLTSDEAAEVYLNGILEDDDPNLLLVAIQDVARARGMAKVAELTGLSRESLYKALASGAKPRFDTVYRVMSALGIRLRATVKSPGGAKKRPARRRGRSREASPKR